MVLKKKNNGKLFTKYEHHGKKVWVTKSLKGKHRTACLCFRCEKFKPTEGKNCPISNMVYSLCVLENLVLPVWECPEFKEGEPDYGYSK
jgi:hypothetical protein